MSESLAANHQEVLRCIGEACQRVGRSPAGVRLLAVSKMVGEEPMRILHALGQRDFGESRVQEALSKIARLPNDIVWHFIGRLQKNKVRRIVSEFAYIHSVDSLKIARYLNDVAGECAVRPRVLLQVNLAGEETKGGFEEGELEKAASELLALPHWEVTGLMCIPPNVDNPEDSRVYFRRLRELRDKLAADHGCELADLSMGMSHDYAIAIEEGATFVRVGSSLFGERSYPVSNDNTDSSTI